jgi:tRNA pseudouridine55 synthase
MPRRRKGRPINGVLLLNKASGITSNKALQQIKHLYKAAKAGHTGSLDPLASGLLPICLGEATKFSQVLLDAQKAYQVTAKLGEKTTTADADGEVIETKAVEITAADIENLIPQFTGKIKQVPSMYSALKHQGKPLYEYAREGITIDRPARDVEIFDYQLQAVELPYIKCYVRCSKGTYIRNLMEDLGDALGCGAHVTALHRVQAGHFTNAQMISFEQLESISEQGFEALDAKLLPMDAMLEHWPSVTLDADMVSYFQQGQALFIPKLPLDTALKVYTDAGLFLGIAELNADGMLAPKRLVVYPEL